MTQDILVSVTGAVGRITLNRPAAINALTLDMVRAIDATFTRWANDDAIAFVVLDGAGERGLCAGGNIRDLYDGVKSNEFAFPEAFFAEEYRLDYRICCYPKPVVALMNGAVMGGGIGISAHASHRIVNERSALAMPEARIGFFTDVGGTHLLSKAPGELGTHIALTSGRLKAADAIHCGLADQFTPVNRWGDLLRALEGCPTASALAGVLADFADNAGPSELTAKSSWIDRCYNSNSAEAILAALREAPEPDAHDAAREMAANSPTSVKLTLEALRRARKLKRLDACFNQEYRIALRALRNADFVEGVRAAVIDKDRAPKWSPSRLEDVTAEHIALYFAPLTVELGLGLDVETDTHNANAIGGERHG